MHCCTHTLHPTLLKCKAVPRMAGVTQRSQESSVSKASAGLEVTLMDRVIKRCKPSKQVCSREPGERHGETGISMLARPPESITQWIWCFHWVLFVHQDSIRTCVTDDVSASRLHWRLCGFIKHLQTWGKGRPEGDSPMSQSAALWLIVFGRVSDGGSLPAWLTGFVSAVVQLSKQRNHQQGELTSPHRPRPRSPCSSWRQQANHLVIQSP